MPPSESELNTKVALLEQNVNSLSGLFERLDDAIDKMGEVSNSINQLLAVHEERISATATDTGELFQLVEKRRQEQDAMEKELHSRITTQGREVKEELRDDYKRLVDSLGEIKSMLRVAVKENQQAQGELETRLKAVERRQWISVGAAMAGGFIIGTFLEILSFFS
tara:strand:- start:4414 stop:4911 length:498 start_codon:yes stop_codon:yes gene_type:complete